MTLARRAAAHFRFLLRPIDLLVYDPQYGSCPAQDPCRASSQDVTLESEQ